THLVLHSFPTRRSSDLFRLESPGRRALPELRVRGDGATADQGDGGVPEVPEVRARSAARGDRSRHRGAGGDLTAAVVGGGLAGRSEEHTSELQSRFDLV